MLNLAVLETLESLDPERKFTDSNFCHERSMKAATAFFQCKLGLL